MLLVDEALAAVLSAAAGHTEPRAVPLHDALGAGSRWHRRDAVVRVEVVDHEQVPGGSDGAQMVRILVQDIRNVGSDIEKDSILLNSGEHIGPAEIGLLATVGVTTVKVYPRPTIAVLSIGDELGQPAVATASHGQIHDSNRAMLLAAAVQQKCKVVDLGIAEDTEESLKEHMDAALCSDADIIIASGGISMGDRNFVKRRLAVGEDTGLDETRRTIDI